MQTTALVILLLALGLGVAEALRAYLPATRLGTIVSGRLQGERASDRLQRFGAARTLASAAAPPPPPVPLPVRQRRTEPAPAETAPSIEHQLIEGFGGDALRSPSMLRIETPPDLAEFARSARSGDLWLRLSDFDGWPDRRARRAALVEAIAAHPEWDDRAVYEAGNVLALWDDDGAYAVHRARNRKRVRRLRAAAVSGLVFLDEVRDARERAATARTERAAHNAA